MTEASNIAHGLLLRHVATPDGQLALPVDPAAIAYAEGIDVPSVGDAYGRWDSAVALGRALEPDGAEFGWPGDFAYALLMPAEIMQSCSRPTWTYLRWRADSVRHGARSGGASPCSDSKAIANKSGRMAQTWL